MDKIWDRKSFEVIGRRGGDEKPNDHAEPQKSNAKIKKIKIIWPKSLIISTSEHAE